MNHLRVVYKRLNIGNRKVPVVLTGKSPRHIDCRQGHVEVESKSLFLPGLAVSKPCVLLAVSQQEFYLESGSVDVHDFLCRHLCVGGEEHLPGLSLLSWLRAVHNDYTHIPLQACGPDDGSIESDRLALSVIVALLLENVHSESRHVRDELTVVAHPVELPLEVLAEAALTGVTEAGHLTDLI